MTRIDIILENDFVAMELAGVVDPARIANRILGEQEFVWTYYSQGGGIIKSSSGISVDTQPIPAKPNTDYAIFLGNRDPYYFDMDVAQLVSRYSYDGIKVILLAEAASRYIASNKRSAINHTTHWENRVLLEEKYGIFGVKSSLTSRHENIMTSGGMASTSELMLNIIAEHISSAKLQILAKIFLSSTIRKPDTIQTAAGQISKLKSSIVRNAIRVMHDNLEKPLSISDISKVVNISTRSLERAFKAELKCNPSSCYREIRLNLAHNLIMNSDMSITEIAIACGYSFGFSGTYKKVFGCSPRDARQQSKLIK